MPNENLQAAVQAGYQETAAQIETGSALDAKLTGVLGFMAAVDALLLTVNHGLSAYRWVLLVGASSAIMLCCLGLMSDDVKAVPDPVAFYRDYGGAKSDDFLRKLLAGVGQIIDSNNGRLEERRNMLTGSFGLALLAAAAFGLARLGVALWS